MTTPSDQPARDAIVERLDENMVVEAGAGTGKTTSLVERVVALVTTGRANMGGIAAITFTEAAAAELRSRIGETLEKASADPDREHVERERCVRAVGDLDQTSIQTLHSFAGSLLRERPIEAGLPPGFNIRDPIEAEVAFERKWSEWLDATLDDPEAQEALRPALAEGLTLRHIREIAVSFNTNYDLLADASFDSSMEQSGENERETALLPVLELLRRFALDYADERKAAGEVEFQDLLVLARDLLRDSIPARDHFRERYSHVLIDEVQDTDPLQAEIAMFLAEDVLSGSEASDRPNDWHRVRPARGKIFIVGDPKQSIYRFRRADIQQVKLLQRLVGGSNALLTRNFRSQSPVIDWVNHVFTQWMQENEGQAKYSPLTAGPSEGGSPPVRYFGGEIGGNIGVVRREEADAIAQTIRTAIEEGWRVRSEDVGSETRPAKYQDVCVLMPSRTGLEGALEYAFETAGIPYRLDSAGLIYESQEARDLLNCLSAIDDPTDQVSVVAALRSPALACSDADLLEFVEAGGQFDYLTDDDPPAGFASDALAVLREFHERRRWTSPASLIEEFVRERRLMELALDARQWRSRWMRYRFLIDRARAFASSGEASLRAYLTWTARQREEQARARETAVPESDEDAVRVMTIHGAKGLEFPFLILAGLNSPPTHRPDAVLFDRERGKVEVKVGSGDSSFQTAGYAEFAELDKLREEEEDVRLMYVAATRA
ncbi:MAG: UvrD-helicase domain-containing protein, partial [Chloroflexota bacterium]|nr:UvrD-helicase domain-containing protein [Chloroflexota bacterium]